MVLEYFILISGFVLLIIGLIGCFLPILPGPPLSYLGMLLIHFSVFAEMTNNFLWWWAAITVGVTILDYYVPIYGARRYGGSKMGVWGASIGMIVGLFFPPIGLIIGPFVGALLGEMAAGRNDSALKSAFGTFIGFLFGIVLKTAACVVMIYYSIVNVSI